jgi:uncharacterized protein YecE (DUF72 family)
MRRDAVKSLSVRGAIRTGMGGWSYEPWRETFYPSDVPQRAELEYASRQVTAIEINSTFYRLQKANIFERWRDSTPEDFKFTTKAARAVTYRKDLTQARESVEWFANGVSALAPKLGAILWQVPPRKKFEREEIATFLSYLPREAQGVELNHVLEVRHASFMSEEFVEVARAARVAIAFVDDATYPSFADLTGDIVYGRLRRCVASEATGYASEALDAWANRACVWAAGGEPDDLPRVSASKAPQRPRDVFLFFINGAKERAPLAARELIRKLKDRE